MSIFMINTLNFLSIVLHVSVLFNSFTEVFSFFFLLEHMPVFSHFAWLCLCFYRLGKMVTSPKLKGVVLYMVTSTQTVCLMTFAGWLKLWLYILVTLLNHSMFPFLLLFSWHSLSLWLFGSYSVSPQLFRRSCFINRYTLVYSMKVMSSESSYIAILNLFLSLSFFFSPFLVLPLHVCYTFCSCCPAWKLCCVSVFVLFAFWF